MYWSNPEKTGNSTDMIEKMLTRMKNVLVRFESKWQNIKLQSTVNVLKLRTLKNNYFSAVRNFRN